METTVYGVEAHREYLKHVYVDFSAFFFAVTSDSRCRSVICVPLNARLWRNIFAHRLPDEIVRFPSHIWAKRTYVILLLF